MKLLKAVVILALALLLSCKSNQTDLRPSMQEVVNGHDYAITSSDANGQVLLIKNISVPEVEDTLRAAGGTPRVSGATHSVWKKDNVIYQLFQSGDNVEAIVLDNPPGN